jgi:protoporphyrinogen oxidase
MVIKSVKKDENFIIKTFDFPQGGSEQLYNKQLQIINKSETIDIQLNCYPIAIIKNEDGFLVDFSTGEKNIFFSDIISTIHLNDLTNILYYDKIDKIKLKHQVSKLMYRNLVLVNLVYNIEDVKSFKEHWIDVHDANVKTLRVTNFSNYNFGLNNSNKVGVGLEYNCFETCDIWHDDDETILKLALNDLKYMKLVDKKPLKFKIIRITKAYPVYFKGYEVFTNNIFNELNKVKGLHLAGRNSLYKWNNMHHSVKTGVLAAQNINGSKHNIFDVKGMVSIGKESD